MTEKDPAAVRLEQLVDQFDSLWQQGKGPKWTEWLRQAGSTVDQTKLARLLVPIELEYRRQRGDAIEPERDYPEANAEQRALVRELLTPSLYEDATLAPNRAAAKVNAPKDLASQTIGPYKLLQKLGEGGMGEVWMAEQKEPVKRRVALKLIKGNATGSREVLARFDAERQALAVMNHPNIARILDAGTTAGGNPFFVMELVQGQPLNQYCDENKLPIEERLKLFCAVCGGVQHAHQKGIIHRDLKPSNILVGQIDGTPIPKIIDFGLAKALESGQRLTDQSLFTGIGQVLGTLKYMSPEQASLDFVDIDTRTDIYALGVILYELLTGSTPLDDEEIRGQAILKLLELVREQEPQRPSSKLSSSKAGTLSTLTAQRRIDSSRLNRILSGDLDWVVMKALEKDRTRRYESVSGLASDIGRYLSNEPVVARPPSLGYRVNKFIRKHRAGVIAASLIGLALVGGIVGTSLALFRALRAETLADQRRRDVEVSLSREHEALEKESVARQAAETARQEAEKNLAFAKKGNEILSSVFSDLDPHAEYDKISDLRTALTNNLSVAIAELETNSVGTAVEAAEIRHSLGKSMLGIGDGDKAAAVLEKTVATFQTELGLNDPRTIESMNDLAVCYHFLGKTDQAIPILQQALDSGKENLESSNRLNLSMLINLADFYAEKSEFSKALPLLQTALEKAGESEDFVDEEVALMNNLGLLYCDLGQLSKGTKMLEDGLELARKHFGPENPNTLTSMFNLAQRKNDLALFEQTYSLRKSRLGEEHPETVLTMSSLANGYVLKEQFTKAIALQEKAYELTNARFGPEHRETLRMVNNLAMVYNRAFQFSKSVQMLELAYPNVKKVIGETHPNTIGFARNLANLHRLNGEYEKAAAVYSEAIAGAEQSLGPEHRETLKFKCELTQVLALSGKLEEALERASQLRPKAETAPYQAESLAAIRETFAATKNKSEFRQVVEKELNFARGLQEQEPLKLASILASIAKNYLSLDQLSPAQAMAREAMLIREKFAPMSVALFDAKSLYGEILLKRGRLDEAEKALVSAYEGLVKLPDPIPPSPTSPVTTTLDRLIQLYSQTDKAEEAEKYRRQRENYLSEAQSPQE